MHVPFFTTDAEHLNNMKALLHKMTNGPGSRFILFGEPYPVFTTFRRLLLSPLQIGSRG